MSLKQSFLMDESSPRWRSKVRAQFVHLRVGRSSPVWPIRRTPSMSLCLPRTF